MLAGVRSRYPKHWEKLAQACKERANWRCETCKIAQKAARISKRTGGKYVVYLHAAPRDHDIGNPEPVLLCLYPACHGRYDYQYRLREQRIALDRLKHHILLRVT